MNKTKKKSKIFNFNFICKLVTIIVTTFGVVFSIMQHVFNSKKIHISFELDILPLSLIVSFFIGFILCVIITVHSNKKSIDGELNDLCYEVVGEWEDDESTKN